MQMSGESDLSTPEGVACNHDNEQLAQAGFISHYADAHMQEFLDRAPELESLSLKYVPIIHGTSKVKNQEWAEVILTGHMKDGTTIKIADVDASYYRSQASRWDKNRAHVGMADVHEDFQGKGLGKIMYVELGERLRRDGVTALEGGIVNPNAAKTRFDAFGPGRTSLTNPGYIGIPSNNEPYRDRDRLYQHAKFIINRNDTAKISTRLDPNEALEPGASYGDAENMIIPGGKREAFLKSKEGQAPAVKQIKWWTDIGHEIGAFENEETGDVAEFDPQKVWLWAIDPMGILRVLNLDELTTHEASYGAFDTHLDWEELINIGEIKGPRGLLNGPAHGRIDANEDVIRVSLTGREAVKGDKLFLEDTKRKLAEYIGAEPDQVKGYDFTGNGDPELFEPGASYDDGENMPIPGGKRDALIKSKESKIDRSRELYKNWEPDVEHWMDIGHNRQYEDKNRLWMIDKNTGNFVMSRTVKYIREMNKVGREIIHQTVFGHSIDTGHMTRGRLEVTHDGTIRVSYAALDKSLKENGNLKREEIEHVRQEIAKKMRVPIEKVRIYDMTMDKQYFADRESEETGTPRSRWDETQTLSSDDVSEAGAGYGDGENMIIPGGKREAFLDAKEKATKHFKDYGYMSLGHGTTVNADKTDIIPLDSTGAWKKKARMFYLDGEGMVHVSDSMDREERKFVERLKREWPGRASDYAGILKAKPETNIITHRGTFPGMPTIAIQGRVEVKDGVAYVSVINNGAIDSDGRKTEASERRLFSIRSVVADKLGMLAKDVRIVDMSLYSENATPISSGEMATPEDGSENVSEAGAPYGGDGENMVIPGSQREAQLKLKGIPPVKTYLTVGHSFPGMRLSNKADDSHIATKESAQNDPETTFMYRLDLGEKPQTVSLAAASHQALIRLRQEVESDPKIEDKDKGFESRKSMYPYKWEPMYMTHGSSFKTARYGISGRIAYNKTENTIEVSIGSVHGIPSYEKLDMQRKILEHAQSMIVTGELPAAPIRGFDFSDLQDRDPLSLMPRATPFSLDAPSNKKSLASIHGVEVNEGSVVQTRVVPSSGRLKPYADIKGGKTAKEQLIAELEKSTDLPPGVFNALVEHGMIKIFNNIHEVVEHEVTSNPDTWLIGGAPSRAYVRQSLGNAQAYVLQHLKENGAVFIADRLSPGQGGTIVLHEIGVHVELAKRPEIVQALATRVLEHLASGKASNTFRGIPAFLARLQDAGFAVLAGKEANRYVSSGLRSERPELLKKILADPGTCEELVAYWLNAHNDHALMVKEVWGDNKGFIADWRKLCGDLWEKLGLDRKSAEQILTDDILKIAAAAVQSLAERKKKEQSLREENMTPMAAEPGVVASVLMPYGTPVTPGTPGYEAKPELKERHPSVTQPEAEGGAKVKEFTDTQGLRRVEYGKIDNANHGVMSLDQMDKMDPSSTRDSFTLIGENGMPTEFGRISEDNLAKIAQIDPAAAEILRLPVHVPIGRQAGAELNGEGFGYDHARKEKHEVDRVAYNEKYKHFPVGGARLLLDYLKDAVENPTDVAILYGADGKVTRIAITNDKRNVNVLDVSEDGKFLSLVTQIPNKAGPSDTAKLSANFVRDYAANQKQMGAKDPIMVKLSGEKGEVIAYDDPRVAKGPTGQPPKINPSVPMVDSEPGHGQVEEGGEAYRQAEADAKQIVVLGSRVRPTPPPGLAKEAASYLTTRFFQGYSVKLHETARATGSAAAREAADLVQTRPGTGAEEERRDIPKAIMTARTKYSNKFNAIMEPLGSTLGSMDTDLREAYYRTLNDMITGRRKITNDAQGATAQRLIDLLKEMHDYRTSAGEDLGVVQQYFPAVYDRRLIIANKALFMADAERAYKIELGQTLQGAELDAAIKLAAQRLFTLHMRGVDDADFATIFGAPVRDQAENSAKERKFGRQAQNIMRKWQVNDPFFVIPHYISSSAKRAELVRRFGNDGKGWLDLASRMEAEGVDYDTILEIRDLVRGGIGIGVAPCGTKVQTFMDFVAAFTAADAMGKSFLNNFVEPISMGVRSGNLLAGLRGYAETWGRTLHLAAQNAPILRDQIGPTFWQEYGNHIGTIHNAMTDAWQTTHAMDLGITGDSNPKLKWLTNRVYLANLQEITESAKQQASHAVGHMFINDAVMMLTGTHWMTKAMKMDMSRSASDDLAELGIPRAKQFAFATWMETVNAIKDRSARFAALTDGSEMAKLYEEAQVRFTHQSAVRANRANKPEYQDNVLGKMSLQLMSFSYSYAAEVNSRMYDNARRAYTGKDYTASDRLRLMGPLAMFPFAVMAFYGLQELKDLLFPTESSEKRKKDPFLLKLLNAASYAGGFGPVVEQGMKYIARDQPPGGVAGKLAVDTGRTATKYAQAGAAKIAGDEAEYQKKLDSANQSAARTAIGPIKGAAVAGASAVHPLAGTAAVTATNTTGWSNALQNAAKPDPKVEVPKFRKPGERDDDRLPPERVPR